MHWGSAERLDNSSRSASPPLRGRKNKASESGCNAGPFAASGPLRVMRAVVTDDTAVRMKGRASGEADSV